MKPYEMSGFLRMKRRSTGTGLRRTRCAMFLLVASILVLAPIPASADLSLSREFIVTSDVNFAGTAIAFNPYQGEFLVVWTEGLLSQMDISAARVSWDGRVLSSFSVSANPGANDSEPSVAFDLAYGRYLIAWTRETSSSEIFGRFIPGSGPNPALTEFKISDSSDDESDPVVVYGRVAEEFLVAWETWPTQFTPGYITGRRVRANDLGFVGDPFILISGLATRLEPDLSYNLARNQFLLTYDLRPAAGGFYDRDVYAQRLSADGSRVGGEIPISTGTGGQGWSSVTTCTGGDQYVVTWMLYAPDDDPVLSSSAIAVQVVNGEGTLEPGPLTFADIYALLLYPRVACDELSGEHLVTWVSLFLPEQTVATIEGMRFGGTSGTTPAAVITEDPGEFGHIAPNSLAAGFHGFLVVWEQDHPPSGYPDIHGRMVWHVFADGFESGNTSAWSSSTP